MDQSIVIHAWRIGDVTMVLVPQMSHKSVQMGGKKKQRVQGMQMGKTLGKMLKC